MSHAMSRRATLRLGGALAAARLGARAPSGAAQAATPAAPAVASTPFEGAAFVGTTDVPDLLFAVVLGTAAAGAYLCDGRGLVAWFTGGSGERLVLSAQDGSRLIATVGADWVAGEAVLADGRTVSFAAERATGIAGLYEILIRAGRAAGAAAGGRRFDGVVAGTLPDGSLLLAGAVALPGGGLRPLAVFASADAAGTQRWIVLDDGRAAGAFKMGAGSGFISPIHTLAMPTSGSYIDPTSDI